MSSTKDGITIESLLSCPEVIGFINLPVVSLSTIHLALPVDLLSLDVLNFFIHAGDNIPLMVSQDGNFTFDDAVLDYDVVYQVCAVAGNLSQHPRVRFFAVYLSCLSLHYRSAQRNH